MLYILFSKQTILFGFSDMADPDNTKQPITGHFDETQALWTHGFCFTSLSYQKSNSIFLLFLKNIKKEIFCPFQDFQGPQPNFKNFPGPGNFFNQFQDFPGFSRTVATLFLKISLCFFSTKPKIFVYTNETETRFLTQQNNPYNCNLDIFSLKTFHFYTWKDREKHSLWWSLKTGEWPHGRYDMEPECVEEGCEKPCDVIPIDRWTDDVNG